MSKGYADYLCVLAREIDREFRRDADGVEAPLFRAEYEEWLNYTLTSSLRPPEKSGQCKKAVVK